MTEFDVALELVEERLRELRSGSQKREFDTRTPAEVEINRFWLDGETVDRIMVVLRSTGCSHYGTKSGCSMCGHYDGVSSAPVSSEDYVAQWNGVLDGTALDAGEFDINRFPILCLYNLGSLLNPEEISPEAVREIFSSISDQPGIRKTIIESRAEYVTPDALRNIREVHRGLVEVGMGLESMNYQVRELCHHKNMPDLGVLERANSTLKDNDFRSLVYVNLKPPFLTEIEAVVDAVESSVYAFQMGADAVSIEPTSLQAHTLTDFLSNLGIYRVPWLCSVFKTVLDIKEAMGEDTLDLRIGGYFDEKVLSGSQGTAPGAKRNEIFPYMTSANCGSCTGRMIEAIQAYNRMYDGSALRDQEPCPVCHPLWEGSLKIQDSRDIPRRIIDVLGGI